LRKQERTRRKPAVPKAEDAQLKGAMGAFRKKPADWEGPEQDVLKRLFAYSPDWERAYPEREHLTAICEEEGSKEQAATKLKAWQEQVEASGLKCDERCLKTLETWRAEIPKYCRQRHNSGFVEGLHNKLKGLKPRCSGIFNLPHLCQRIFLDLEGSRLFASPVG
jgi:transposase